MSPSDIAHRSQVVKARARSVEWMCRGREDGARDDDAGGEKVLKLHTGRGEEGVTERVSKDTYMYVPSVSTTCTCTTCPCPCTCTCLAVNVLYHMYNLYLHLHLHLYLS